MRPLREEPDRSYIPDLSNAEIHAHLFGPISSAVSVPPSPRAKDLPQTISSHRNILGFLTNQVTIL
jgi:hypothetical protein